MKFNPIYFCVNARLEWTSANSKIPRNMWKKMKFRIYFTASSDVPIPTFWDFKMMALQPSIHTVFHFPIIYEFMGKIISLNALLSPSNAMQFNL